MREQDNGFLPTFSETAKLWFKGGNLLLSLVLAGLSAWLITAKPAAGIGLIVALVGSIFTLVKLELGTYKRLKRTLNKPDQELYNEFLEILPSDRGVIYEISPEIGILPSFRREILKDLYDFVDHWDNPEHEFHDEQVEKAKEDLLGVANNLLEFITEKTAPHDQNPDVYKLTSKIQVDDPSFRSTEEDYDPRTEIQRDLEEGGKLQDEVLEKHQEFIETAKSRLGV